MAAARSDSRRRTAARAGSTARQPGERSQETSHQERRHIRNRHLALELEQDAGEVGEPRQPGAAEVARPGHRLVRLKELLSPKRRSHLHARLRELRAGIAEPVRLANRHHNRLTGAGVDDAATEAETHPAGENRELFLLDWMGVARGDVSTRREKEIEDEELAARFGGRLTHHDAFAADWVLDHATLFAGNHRELRVGFRADGVNSSAIVTGSATSRLK